MRRAGPLVLAAALAVPAGASEDPALRPTRGDTIMHFSGSMVGSLLLIEFFQSKGYPKWKATALGAGLVFLGGLVKEVATDSFVSENDLVADALGAGLAVGFRYRFRFGGLAGKKPLTEADSSTEPRAVPAN